ncbi:MAG: menaquinone biosynthesis protein [Prolixibacteraceae bacterium]|nr:menaquinone biosynthesis protein [Prolixibacteraceae bacterium]
MGKSRVSVISYLNSKPFLFGLNESLISQEIQMSLDIPSKTVSKLAFNQTDIGLVPVGGLEDLDKYEIFSNYCIGSVGKVRTVVLASEVPLPEIDTVLMDYQSRSSVLLSKVLSKFYWQKDFRWENTCAGFENRSIGGSTAGVVIGDRVFEVEKRLPFIYDLSEEWFNFTGLPFVFAAWATNKLISRRLKEKFNDAFAFGTENIPEIVKLEQENYPDVDIFDYFTQNISFGFDEEKREGMRKFLELAKKLEPIELAK